MAVNKVMDSNGNVLIDLTGDTVTDNKVLQGYIFHKNDGTRSVGTLPSGGTYHMVDNKDYPNLVRFFDYDGTVIAEYSIAEANALNSLPTPPDHTDIGLVFQEWNWTLEEVQNTTHSLDIGAIYDTDHHGMYLHVQVPSNTSITLYLKGTRVSWGDGDSDTLSTSTESSIEHTYTTAGVYVISVESDIAFTSLSFGAKSNIRKFFRHIFFGTYYSQLTTYSTNQDMSTYSNLLTITFAKTDGTFSPPSNFARSFMLVKFLAYPKSTTVVLKDYSLLSYNLRNVSFPSNVDGSQLSSQFMYGLPLLETFILDSPNIKETVTQICSNCANLRYVYIKSRNGNVLYKNNFVSCVLLGKVDVDPIRTTVPSNYVNDCRMLSEIDVSHATALTNYGSCFINCFNLKRLDFSLLTNLDVSMIGACYNLEEVTAPLVTSITGSFSNLYSLQKFILSGQESPPSIATSTINACPVIFYVAPGTLSLYAQATNWSVLVAEGRVQELEVTE